MMAFNLAARHVFSYQVDDGGRPVAQGAYTLTWHGRVGRLKMTGTPTRTTVGTHSSTTLHC